MWRRVWFSFVQNPVLVFYVRFILIYQLLDFLKFFVSKNKRMKLFWLNYVKLLKNVIINYGNDFVKYFEMHVLLKEFWIKINCMNFLKRELGKEGKS